MTALRVVETLAEQAPPYPPDTRIKGFKFDLDVERLRQSDTWSLAKPEQRPWLLMLWVTAWEQIPAGSFPNDDEIIAAKIGMNVDQFTLWRKVLMRGWTMHSDGRLYHSVIASRVLQIVEWRDNEAKRKAAYRKQRTDALSHVRPQMSHGTDAGQTSDSGGNPDTSTSTSTSTSLKPVIHKSPVVQALSGGAPDAPRLDVTKPEQWDFKSPPARGQEARYILAFLNKVTGHKYQDAEANTKLIRSRLKESSVRQAKHLIVVMADRWETDDKMREYLRPATLFNATNYHQYLGQLPPMEASHADANPDA